MHGEVERSVEGARRADEQGELAAWVAGFLRSDGSDNAALADQLNEQLAAWCGPLELRFDELHRLAGPADQPTLGRLDADDQDTVEHMAESVDDGWAPPPLIVSFNAGQFVVEDGNHRIEGLRESGRDRYWAVIGFEHESQRDAFVRRTEQVAELLELEEAGWTALCDGTGSEFYGSTMTDGGRMVLANGMVMTRSEVIASLDDAPPWASFELTDPKIVPIGDDSAALLYTGTGHRDDGDFSGVMTSVYVRIDDVWRLALYQQTPSE